MRINKAYLQLFSQMRIFFELMTVNERFQLIIDDLYKGNKRAFAQAVGVNPTVVENVVGKRQGKPSYDFMEKVCANANISSRWLLMGQGDMLEENAVYEATQIHYPKSFERKDEMQAVNVYNLHASAGIQELFDNGDEHIIDTIYIPNMPHCDGAIFITGESMSPILRPHDLILFQRVDTEEANIFYNQMYLISYSAGGQFYTVCKYIRKSEKGFPAIVLASENPDYPDREIDFRRVQAMALVKASVHYGGML